MIGSIAIALLVEKSRLHYRIALCIMQLVGEQPAHLMGGFMLVTCLLSMILSNTATTVMMVPIVEAVCEQIETHVKLKSKGSYFGMDQKQRMHSEKDFI